MNRNTYAVAVAATCLGLMAGGIFVYQTVPSREPAPCREAREITDDYLIGQANLISAIQTRATAADFIEIGKADDEVKRIVAELEPLTATYDRTFKACEEAS